ncbi:MAG: hypothetical protein A2148_00370 [Chloroflexi bacterium RBG_16_68_14]|nr:MAG: hypothetical protein A2148_00370 [Chloroflexi bacterium RBG_16_68_14]
MKEPTSIPADALASSLLELLLAVHSAPDRGWLVEAATTVAERSLGALYSLLYIADDAGGLAGERPASSIRQRALAKLSKVLGTEVAALKFDPREHPIVLSTIQQGHAVALAGLDEALPWPLPYDKLRDAERALGVAQTWLAPLYWGGASSGLLVLLMPADPSSSLTHAEILARHLAVALANLREKEAGRKRGELDAVRWVYDERRFLEELRLEVRRASRHQRPLSILLARVCNLAQLRTRYGRFLAERVLRYVAARLPDAMRETDFLAASGQDGFAAILVEADREGAWRAEQRLRAGLETVQLPHANLPDLHVELGCAIATLRDDGETAEELIAAAQARLGHEPAQDAPHATSQRNSWEEEEGPQGPGSAVAM